MRVNAALGALVLAMLGVAALVAAAVSHLQSQAAHEQELMQVLAVPAQRELENFEVQRLLL